MFHYDAITKDIGVPIANKKSEGPTTLIEYVGLTIDTVNTLVKLDYS